MEKSTLTAEQIRQLDDACRQLDAELQPLKDRAAGRLATQPADHRCRLRRNAKVYAACGRHDMAALAYSASVAAERQVRQQLHRHRQVVLERRSPAPILRFPGRHESRPAGRPAARRASGIRSSTDPGDDGEPEHDRGDLHLIGPAVVALVDALDLADSLWRAA